MSLQHTAFETQHLTKNPFVTRRNWNRLYGELELIPKVAIERHPKWQFYSLNRLLTIFSDSCIKS